MKKYLLFFIVALMSLITNYSNRLFSQSTCCPDFILADATNVCPAEGACAHPSPDPAGGNYVPVVTACKLTPQIYTVFPNLLGFTYTWSVTNGTPANFTGNPITVLWDSGNSGHIRVIISDAASGGNCRDSIDQDVCLINGPNANFTFSPNPVCTSTPVHFVNTSAGGSVFLWKFGDGTTSSLANPPDHIYNAPGTYTVTLIAQDMGAGQPVPGSNGGENVVPCGCIDSISKIVTVLAGVGPDIVTDCRYGTVCPGDTSYLCTTMTCSTYNWSVTGGTIISGAGTSCIQVKWNLVYTVPTTVTLQSCPSAACTGSTTIHVPVLYPNLPINGPAIVCIGASGSYSLPSMPGTYYHWTVSGGLYSFNQANKNVATVNISFLTMGSYWVKCQYHNPLAGCNGADSMQVNVLPLFTVYGPETTCESDVTYYNANGPANWTITPAGPIILTGNGTSTISVSFTPGNYVVTATSLTPLAFCNTTATKNVHVIAKPVLNNIVGNNTICPGQNLTYTISSNVTGSLFTWSITSGTGTILSQIGTDNNTAVVNFSGTGPWTLSVYQQIEMGPGQYCQSLNQTLNIFPNYYR